MIAVTWFSWSLIAALFWGLGPVFAKLGLVKPDPLIALTVRNIGVLAILLVWTLGRGDLTASLLSLDLRTWILLVLEGASASVIAHFAYFKALKMGNIASVVPITASYPLVSVILSAILLGNKVTLGKAVGVLLTVTGIYLLQRF
ncbi:MAG: EamA family transporter [Candidatus Fermentithermobacillus carboniphilus]|uniref:EamA family transporter n=1 Tax=Candidatus Fermentithermobacillus carboniphilus TaxID=3085328 RepID=A0AAT9LFT5_9FIRM|nr:MAG: EamA family transporter [Candidatus Fermentithermobacillus carboniphilus]